MAEAHGSVVIKLGKQAIGARSTLSFVEPGKVNAVAETHFYKVNTRAEGMYIEWHGIVARLDFQIPGFQ